MTVAMLLCIKGMIARGKDGSEVWEFVDMLLYVNDDQQPDLKAPSCSYQLIKEEKELKMSANWRDNARSRRFQRTNGGQNPIANNRNGK